MLTITTAWMYCENVPMNFSVISSVLSQQLYWIVLVNSKSTFYKYSRVFSLRVDWLLFEIFKILFLCKLKLGKTTGIFLLVMVVSALQNKSCRTTGKIKNHKTQITEKKLNQESRKDTNSTRDVILLKEKK